MPNVTITMDRNDLGQIIDGLTARMESYDFTERYFDDEEINDENNPIEDVSNSDEARRIADYYRKIITGVSQQLEPQALEKGGMSSP